jgi:uncharacterized delta-60 repeat protein
VRHILIFFTLFLFSLTVISCSRSSDSGSSTTTYTTDNTTEDDNSTTTDNITTTTDTTELVIAEITQTLGDDGYRNGSFVVPNDGISFLLSTFLDNNSSVGFYSLTDPDGTNILSSTSALYNRVSGSTGDYGFANVLVPQSPSFSAKAGTWTFKNYGNDRVKLAMRSGSTPSNAIIVVQPYITGTTWSANDISEALSVMSVIYAKNGITLNIKSTITISGSQYASVSLTFTDSTTSALVSQGSTDAVNLFFVEDYSDNESSVLGNAAGIPGSMRIANSWNGVLNSLTAHATGTTLNAQRLGETAVHEMGHYLGLFHTTEKSGTKFDILSDTPECAISRDNNSDGKVSAKECDGYGAENIMFWTTLSSSSRAAGEKKDTLSSDQQHVLRYSPISDIDTNPDTTSPTVTSTSPSNGTTSVSFTSSISVTFSESMDATSVTTNSSGTSCSGTIQLSSDSFSTCVQMSSLPSESNSYKTFTVSPSSSLSSSTTYKIRVTTGVKDFSGNTLSSQYETSSGFTILFTQQLGTSSKEDGHGVTVDSSDNIYVTGYTYGGLDGNTNSGENDIFLVKFNSSGVKQWTQQLGTSSKDYGRELTVDSSDNIYVTGYTEGGLDGNTNSGENDIFLVKFNSNGVKQGTKQLGTSSQDYARGVTADSSNNIYVSGSTYGGLDGNTNSGSYDTFLVKYNSSGTKQWTQQLGTSSRDIVRSVTVDSSDNIYLTGYTYGGLDGNTNSGENDIFLVKYNSSGTKQWTKQLGSTSSDVGFRVSVDSSDNIYLTGYTAGGLDWNTNSGDNDTFLVKYNSSGVKQWTQQLGTSTDDLGYGVAVDSLDNIYLTGWTQGGLDGNINAGGQDIFLVKYNSSGVKQWTQQLGSTSHEVGLGVTVDSSDNIYVTGSTYGGLDGNTNSGNFDIFLMKFNSDGVKQ